jgi:hypothetical protein
VTNKSDEVRAMKSAELPGVDGKSTRRSSPLSRHLFLVTFISSPLFVTCSVLDSAAHAQTYPGKPLRLVAGMPPGGGADTNARRLAPILAKVVEQTILIDNIPGGAGNLAAQTVAGGGSDGNTLLFASHPILAINSLLYERLPFNPDQLTPIALMSQTPHILLVNSALPAASVAELVRHAKAKHGQLRLRRFRHLASPRGRASAKHGGHHAGPRALSRLRAGNDGTHRQ